MYNSTSISQPTSDLKDASMKEVLEKSRGESLLPSDNSRSKLNGKTMAKTSKYPKAVLLILGTEFCERFNYYGMRTILVIYMTEWLGQGYHSAVALFHMFAMLAYFTPIAGAIIADGYLGRYRTILYISLVYAAGTLVLALTAFPPPELYGPIIGLLLISVGTGGIKPCVTAFGGDQFSSGQEKQRTSFFSAFYFMINLGSMLSTFITPVLRADVHCIGDSCYPLAFGVPTILMLLSIVLFLCGRNHYKHIPPTGNLFGRVARCVWRGASLRIKHGKLHGAGKHWMDYATDKFEESFVSDVKAVLNVLWLFIPLPLFWTLFDQQGSRWTLQAVDMNGDVGNLGRLHPDQMQVLNPILILVLIPFFERLVYPCLDWIKVPNKPLQRICAGMLLCSAAFVLAGFVQLKLEAGQESPLNGQAGVRFMNAARCNATIKSSFYSGSLSHGQMSESHHIPARNVTFTVGCDAGRQATAFSQSISTEGDTAYRVVIFSLDSKNITAAVFPDSTEHDKDGKALLSFAALLPPNYPAENISVELRKYHDKETIPYLEEYVGVGKASDFLRVEPGNYQVVAEENSTVLDALKLGSGSVQTVVLSLDTKDKLDEIQISVDAVQFVTLQENKVSLFWQIPQYVVITCGEILFSITGLSFAYSQAPATMKSVLQAAWLLTVGMGNFIVILAAEARLVAKQSSEFFAFACLMVADTLLFSVMAYFYVSYSAPEGKVEYSRTVADPDVNDTSTLVDSMAGSSSPKVKVVKAVQDGEDKED